MQDELPLGFLQTTGFRDFPWKDKTTVWGESLCWNEWNVGESPAIPSRELRGRPQGQREAEKPLFSPGQGLTVPCPQAGPLSHSASPTLGQPAEPLHDESSPCPDTKGSPGFQTLLGEAYPEFLQNCHHDFVWQLVWLIGLHEALNCLCSVHLGQVLKYTISLLLKPAEMATSLFWWPTALKQ